MKHDELQLLLSDYVLGLLEPAQAGEVRGHLAHCISCRRRVASERRLGMAVAETLQTAGGADPRRLRELMPAPPAPRLIRPAWSRQLVPLTAVLLLLVGAALLRAPQSQPSLPALFYHTATATVTHTPTATLAQRAPIQTALPAPSQTPLPAATPVIAPVSVTAVLAPPGR